MVVRRDKTNYLIQSVAHALDVLEQFFGDVDELGVTELSKRLKLHKNNVFRLLATLEARGYIEQNKATENYRLGIKCLHLGRRYIEHMGLVRQARPILAEVSRKCRESAYVAVYRREGVVPLEAVDPEDRAVRITSPVGPDAAASLYGGRQDPSRVRHRRADSSPRFPKACAAYTERTIIDRAQLFAQLEAVAKNGYCDGKRRVPRRSLLGSGSDSRLHPRGGGFAGRIGARVSDRGGAGDHGNRADDPGGGARVEPSSGLQRISRARAGAHEQDFDLRFDRHPSGC